MCSIGESFGSTVRERRLRWPVPDALGGRVAGRRFTSVGARKISAVQLRERSAAHSLGHVGKFADDSGGRAAGQARSCRYRVRIRQGAAFHRARKFGSMHWQPAGAGEHPLLQGLGPEPLGDEFSGALLYRKSRGRKTAVKHLIMDSRTVAGVGNIYACEALFLAGIHPARACGRISARRCEKLAETIRSVLAGAIRSGGTSLRDFTGGDGKPGYFKQQLNVYGRRREKLCAMFCRTA